MAFTIHGNRFWRINFVPVLNLDARDGGVSPEPVEIQNTSLLYMAVFNALGEYALDTQDINFFDPVRWIYPTFGVNQNYSWHTAENTFNYTGRPPGLAHAAYYIKSHLGFPVGNSKGYEFTSSNDPTTASKVRREIDNNRPFKVGGMAHSQCVYGYGNNGTNVYTNDTYGGTQTYDITHKDAKNMTTAIPHITVPDNVAEISQAFALTNQDEAVFLNQSSSLNDDFVNSKTRLIELKNSIEFLNK